MSDRLEKLDYVAIRPCGCWCMWMSSDAPKKGIAKEVAAMIRKGFEIQRWPTEKLGTAPHKCEKCQKE